VTSEAAKGADGEPSPAKTIITPAEPADQATPTRVRAKPVTPRPSRVYAVELPSFEGPLDLLLHLVRRHELDILDIPIAFVTEKYLEYLSIMRALDIEILGDYLVMAATLAYLKSRELVPQQASEEEGGEEDDEDGEDPREALIRRLIEYERFRAAGRELNEMPVIGRDVFARGGSIDLPPLDPGMAPVTLFRLTEAYARVLARAQINKSHEVQLERVTVRQRMEQLSLLLEERESVEFESLFLEQEWGSVEELRQMLVVTLMSVLELVKLGIIGVRQAHETESIHLQKRASHAEAMKALTSYSEDDSFGEGGGVAGGGQPVTPEASPGVASPVETEAGETEPGVASPVETEAGETELGVASPVETEAGETEAGETGTRETEPGVASPVEAEAGETELGVGSPIATETVASHGSRVSEGLTPYEEPAALEVEPRPGPGAASVEQARASGIEVEPGVEVSGASAEGVASSVDADEDLVTDVELDAEDDGALGEGSWRRPAPSVEPGALSEDADLGPVRGSLEASVDGEEVLAMGRDEVDRGGLPEGRNDAVVGVDTEEDPVEEGETLGELGIAAFEDDLELGSRVELVEKPAHAAVDGEIGAFPEDALGAMLASVRRLEAEGELRDAPGDAALSPDPGPHAQADGESRAGPGGAPDSGRDAEREGPAGGVPGPTPGAGRDAERDGRAESGDVLAAGARAEREAFAGAGVGGVRGEERERSGLGPGLSEGSEPGATPEASQEGIEEARGGAEPTFIDAIDDPGESHE